MKKEKKKKPLHCTSIAENEPIGECAAAGTWLAARGGDDAEDDEGMSPHSSGPKPSKRWVIFMNGKIGIFLNGKIGIFMNGNIGMGTFMDGKIGIGIFMNGNIGII